MNDRWSNDVDYAFSFNKSTMWLLGVWPLQKNDLSGKIRWAISVAMLVFITFSYLVELQMECGAHARDLETVVVIESTLHVLINNVFSRIHLKKLAVNVDSAISDWCSPVRKDSQGLMKRYARVGRTITMVQANIALIGICSYYGMIITMNEMNRSKNSTRDTVFASSCIVMDPSMEEYVMIMVLQAAESAIILTGTCGMDSFIVNITMHLCAQFEILKASFIEFGNKSGRAQGLGTLIDRHYELISLAGNIEDTYNVGILLQILMSVIAVAFACVRLMISVQLRDNIDILKSLIVIAFATLQSSLIVYASDALQNHSESIFHAMYEMPWHDITPSSARNLIFVMVRSGVPIRYSAGKFFYISRVTMIDMLRASFSYISFLRMSMKDLN